MRRSLVLFISSFMFAAALLPEMPVAAEETTPAQGFESEEWTITAGQVVEHLGRQALAGTAFLKDVEFTDGVIEVDVAMDGRRCFPGVVFRAQTEADTEIFYIRPHRSKNYSHALQYTPRFKGVTGWQLYSGPGFTAGADIPLERWVHLKIEVQGSRARIFFDDMETPVLIVGDLKRGTESGYIGVTAPPDGRVHYSNFSYSLEPALDFGPQPIRPAAQGFLTDWEISAPIAPPQINRDRSPGVQDLGEISWRKVTADANGLIDVSRFFEDAPRLPACLIARTILSTEQAKQSKLLFGYSDEISVFLNGDLLFRGDSTFRVRDTEFMGVIGLNDAVVLNLEKGDNELVFVVTESFGGWGFTARTEKLRTDPILLADGVAKSWDLTEGLVMPESAVWDPKRKQFYVSNISPAGPGAYGETGFISRIAPNGDVLDLQWIDGLRGPTGVAVVDDRLYIVERTGVAVVDLEKGEIIERRPVETERGFLNDLAVSHDHAVYVGDSARGIIYISRPDAAELWLSNGAIAGVNGLVVHGEKLVATTMGSESLVFIDLESKAVESVIDLRPFGGDGITSDGAGAFLVSDFNGLLLHVTPAGGRTVLIDSRDAGISLTDFAFSPEHSLVLVPTLRGNSVLAYDIEGAIGGNANNN